MRAMRIAASGLLIVAGLISPVVLGQTTTPTPEAMLSGTVTADQGEVRAVRVKANDIVHKIVYTVFTQKGQYRIFNLPPGTYQVSALQEGFESTTPIVEVKTGKAGNADLVLTTKREVSKTKIVDFDELYPPGPARDLLMKECAGCHSFAHIPWHKMSARNEEGWRAAVNRMFEVFPPSPVPRVAPGVVSDEEKELLVNYFAANFGEDSTPRDFRRDPLPLDENALSQAIYVQYELPPVGKNASGENVTRRSMHDVYPSRVSHNIWFVDMTSGAVLGMDTQNPDYQQRYKEWLIPSPTRFSVTPHGIIETNGHVYFTELQNSSIGELDPRTGEIHVYPTPEKGLPHTPRQDSKGNVWFSKIYNKSTIDMLDAETKKITEWDPSPNYRNANYYGLIVDKLDRVWAAGMTAHIIVEYDPRSGKWTTYPTPTQPSGPRRLTAAPDGRIWFSENIGDAIGVLDPVTGKITEYKSPFRHGGEYECYSDAEGNIWVSLRAYNTLAEFNPKTMKYTYYPYPVLTGFVPKIETDAEGTIWFGVGTTLTSLRVNGNVPLRKQS